jgi:hypothetical protein
MKAETWEKCLSLASQLFGFLSPVCLYFAMQITFHPELTITNHGRLVGYFASVKAYSPWLMSFGWFFLALCFLIQMLVTVFYRKS